MGFSFSLSFLSTYVSSREKEKRRKKYIKKEERERVRTEPRRNARTLARDMTGRPRDGAAVQPKKGDDAQCLWACVNDSTCVGQNMRRDE